MRTLIALLVLLLVALPVSAQSSTPQPIPLPTQQMYEQMATANAQINNAPANLTAPNGAPILPSEDGRQMFGYLKWLVSPAAADEWAGPFAPIFQHLGIGLTMVFVLMGVYTTVYVIANIGSWVGWLLETARKSLDLLFQAVQAAPILLVLVVILFIAFLLFTQQGVLDWVDSQLDGVIDWVYEIVSKLTGGA